MANGAPLIHLLQTAVTNDSYATYKHYSDGVWALPPVSLRHLMALRPGGDEVPLEEVEFDHRNPQALRDAGHEPGRAVARSA